MARYEIPEELSREEERALLAALERYFRNESPLPDPWVLAGRVDASRQGALQTRKLARQPWTASSRAPFARRGADPRRGRGDAG